MRVTQTRRGPGRLSDTEGLSLRQGCGEHVILAGPSLRLRGDVERLVKRAHPLTRVVVSHWVGIHRRQRIKGLLKV